MNFKELVYKRQSCRDFNDKPLDKSVVYEIASVAMNAPSACNSQPWKMYLVTDPNKVKEVAKCAQDSGHNMFTEKAKAFIVITEQSANLKESISKRFDRYHFVKYDIGELVAYITLYAEDLGVSSCIIGWINKDNLNSALNITGEECNIMIALGYSDIPVREKKRKDIQTIIKEI